MSWEKYLVLAGILLCQSLLNNISAQKVYQVDATTVKVNLREGKLDLGGKSITGESIEVNNFYLKRNGKPFIPVMGEFHYSRFPNQYWEEQIMKIKAGGVTVIATYVFWNLHEPKEGQFQWDGDLDLRRFVVLCKAHGMDVIVRIGPFDHGEMRNGGLPDWLYGRPFEVRSNDPEYLSYVKKLYDQIGLQIKGLLFKDGGPVLGIQLENEYQHSAAPWSVTYAGAEKEYTTARRDRRITQGGVGVNEMGNDYGEYGQRHMQLLKKIAKEAGMDVPIYTATGWGFASIVKNGSIPVMAGYAYPFWEEGNKPSPFYLFRNLHKRPDYAPVSYEPEEYPSLAAELGTGMAVTYARRPRVPGESFLPLMVRTIGSGSNGLGYYMYQGGNTPSNGFMMYSEGFGLNLKSYDYQAPIGEFGNPGTGYYGLKIINSFLKHYGDMLAPLFPVIPETNTIIAPQDTVTLRYSVRTDGQKGFLFMHNFQDHMIKPDLKGLQISIKTNSGTINIPETGNFTLQSGVSAIFPFGMDFDGISVKYATIQPLCRFSKQGTRYQVFTAINGISPEIVIPGKVKITANVAKIVSRNGNTVVLGKENQSFEFVANGVHFLVIPFDKAQHAYLVGNIGSQSLVISDALILEGKTGLQLIGTGQESWKIDVYPGSSTIQSAEATITRPGSKDKLFARASVEVKAILPEIRISQVDDRHIVLDAKGMDFAKLHDVFVRFNYRGDRALCMLNGELATDNLYTSQPWQIGLKRYSGILKSKEMYFYFLPILKDAPYLSYLDKSVIPDFSKHVEYLEIPKPEIIPEYLVNFEIK